MNCSNESWQYGNVLWWNIGRVTLQSDISMKGNPLEWINVCDINDVSAMSLGWMQRRVTLLLDKWSKGNP